MRTNWYESFFEGMALDLWRKAATPEMTRAEVNFLAKQFASKPGAHLLDVPCGNGRHALALSALGYRVSGVDISPGFISEARQRAIQAGVDIEFLQADMRDLPWHAVFDGAFCFGNSFGYLDYGGMTSFVHAVTRALKPGARFIVDNPMAAEVVLPRFEARRWFKMDDILFLIDSRYVASDSRVDTEYTFLRNGKQEIKPASHWVYTVAEIHRLLTNAGLHPEFFYGSLDAEEFRLGSPRLIIAALKE
jgi:SAM-dependent methyltransferase